MPDPCPTTTTVIAAQPVSTNRGRAPIPATPPSRLSARLPGCSLSPIAAAHTDHSVSGMHQRLSAFPSCHVAVQRPLPACSCSRPATLWPRWLPLVPFASSWATPRSRWRRTSPARRLPRSGVIVQRERGPPHQGAVILWGCVLERIDLCADDSPHQNSNLRISGDMRTVNS